MYQESQRIIMVAFNSRIMAILGGITAFLLVSVLATPSSGSPHFKGLLSVTPTGPDSITLSWNPAGGNQNVNGEITYLIYQASKSGEQNNNRPSYTTKDTSYQVTGLASNTTYYFVVRAKDHNGQVDSNRVEHSAATFGRWIKKTPVAAPQPRRANGMTYDSKSGQVILFGGRAENGELNDMWIYNIVDNTWVQQIPSTPVLPSPRAVRNLAYIDGGVVVVGGLTSFTPITFEHKSWIYKLDKHTWAPFPAPADLSGYGFSPNFVYDSANKVIVLFGGKGGTTGGHETFTGETWEFDAARETWTQIFPSTSPSPRKHHAMVYDSLNRKVILFGGETHMTKSSHMRKSNETWVYEASTDAWAQMFPSTSPSPRAFHEMVYDSLNQQVILFGGIVSEKNQDITNETWVYNIADNNWFQINLLDAPSPRFHHTMVYDPVGKKVILFGGGTVLCHEPHCIVTTGLINDTWVYE
jgi:N-acetylneuraminic acid mutarotase